MKEFTVEECRIIRDKLKECLTTLEQEQGIKINIGKMGYNKYTIETKLTVQVMDDTGINKGEEEKYRAVCGLYGIDSNSYNKTIVINGQKVRVIGFNNRKKKSPLMVILEDGTKAYTVITDNVLSQLNNN